GVRARLADDLQEAVVVLAPAQRARAVAGRERGRLVEEEQLGEAPRLEQRSAVPAAEAQAAGDPAAAVVMAADPAARVVQTAPVAVHEPASRGGDQVAERGDAILQSHARSLRGHGARGE